MTGQPDIRFNDAKNLYRDIQWTFDGISTYQLHAVLLRELPQTCGEFGQPIIFCFGAGDRVKSAVVPIATISRVHRQCT
jgi:hypothetical protein